MPASREWITARMGRVVTVRPEETIARAAEHMRDNNVGALVVVDAGGAIVGILTERDIISRSTAAQADPERMRAADVMTVAPLSCTPGASAGEAHQLMVAYGIRHLPIVEDGKPVGMISSRDILAQQLRVSQAMKAVAEQVALMGKNLKSLDLDEVLGVVVSDVPNIFQARRSVLCFADDRAEGGGQPLIRGNRCPRCERGLLGHVDIARHANGSEALTADVPQVCKELGCQNGRFVIGLGEPMPARDGGGPPGQRQGYLCMCGLEPEATASEGLLGYKAELVRSILSVYLTNAKLYRDARRNSLIDALTRLATRGALEERLALEYKRTARYGRGFCAIMIDVDSFKAVNDRHGHAAGDRALQSLADIFRSNTRASDVTARYGGDEFVVLMPETRLDDAMTMAERLRSQVHKGILGPQGQRITISCGVAEWSAGDNYRPEDVLRRADAALYEAKRAGRNRVTAAAA